MQVKPTIAICFSVTLLLVSIIALGGVPDGKHRAREMHNTTGVSTAIGDCPFAGPKYRSTVIVHIKELGIKSV